MHSLPPPPHSGLSDTIIDKLPPPSLAMTSRKLQKATAPAPAPASASASASPSSAGHMAPVVVSTPSVASAPVALSASLLPLLDVSIVDMLAADPRPSFVLALMPPPASITAHDVPLSPSASDFDFSSSDVFVPHVVYSNPALSSSPTLCDTISVSQSPHSSLWADIGTTNFINGPRPSLPAVHYAGIPWTRIVLNHGQLAVISADITTVADTATRIGPAKQPASDPVAPFTPATAPAPALAPALAPATDTVPTAVPSPPMSASSPTAHMETTDSHLHMQPHASNHTASASPHDSFNSEASPETDMLPLQQQNLEKQEQVQQRTPIFKPETLLIPPTEITNGDSKSSSESHQYISQISLIADHVPVGLSIFDADWNVFFANKAWYSIMGITPLPEGQIMKQAEFLQYIVEEDQPAVLRSHEHLTKVPSITFGFRVKKRSKDAQVKTTASSPTRFATEFRPCTAESNEFSNAVDSVLNTHVLATATADKDANGNLLRAVISLRDITEEHQNIAAAVDLYAQQARNLQRMTEYATVGLYDMDIDGRLRGANRVFYEICGLDVTEDTDLTTDIVKPWLHCVAEEDIVVVTSALDRLSTDGVYQSVEVRLKKPWISDDGAGNQINTSRWIDVTLLPVKDAKGRVFSITGCVCDVSLRKWQLERERQVKEEAIESRRQQENFVDVTSHEIRNPLTVIMHCGDAILESLSHIRKLTKEAASAATNAATTAATTVATAKTEPAGSTTQAAEAAAVATAETAAVTATVATDTESAIDDAIDYAEIIVGSALHQKSIVDDILTMSKLDSDLLTVTPVTVDPIDIVRSTLRMFEVQARQQDIALTMTVDPSFKALGTRYLDLDPARVKQILINLMTNALKFTRSRTVREIKVNVSASLSRPTDETCSVAFVPRTENKVAKMPNTESGLQHGSSLFLIFEVRDTGEGLTKEGRDTLFQKFVQVDSTTHVKHGGSGLGLFISKRLAEIQNGAIGVASQPDVGSTFAFYVEAHVSPVGVVPEVLSPSEAAKQAIAAGLGAPPKKSPVEEAVTTAAAEVAAAATIEAEVIVAAAGVSPSVSGTTSATEGIPGKEALVPSLTDAATSSRRSNIRLLESHQEKGSDTLPDVASARGAKDGSRDVDAKLSLTPVEAVPLDSVAGQLAQVPKEIPRVLGVLLVEDNVVNQKVTRRFFEKDGFSVQVAANGLEAMEKIQQSDRCVPGSFPISVVLMDMEMPVQGGLECTQNIRALEAAGKFSGGRIPVLMITGNARPEQIAEARAAGCDDVIIKPFQMQVLYEHIQVVLRMLWEQDKRLLAIKGEAEEVDEAEGANGAKVIEEEEEEEEETATDAVAVELDKVQAEA